MVLAGSYLPEEALLLTDYVMAAVGCYLGIIAGAYVLTRGPRWPVMTTLLTFVFLAGAYRNTSLIVGAFWHFGPVDLVSDFALHWGSFVILAAGAFFLVGVSPWGRKVKLLAQDFPPAFWRRA